MSPCRSAASQHTTAQATRATLDASRRSEHRGNRYRRIVGVFFTLNPRVFESCRLQYARVRHVFVYKIQLHCLSSSQCTPRRQPVPLPAQWILNTSKRLHMDMLTLTPTSPAPRPSTVALLPALPSPRRAAGAVAPIRLSLGRRAHTSRNCTTARPPLQTAPPAQHKRPTQFTAGKCDVSKVWGGMRLLDLAGTVK